MPRESRSGPIALPLDRAPQSSSSRSRPGPRQRLVVVAAFIVLSTALAWVQFARSPRPSETFEARDPPELSWAEAIGPWWNSTDGRPPRIAVIGGGAAGTSSAFFLDYLSADLSRSSTSTSNRSCDSGLEPGRRPEVVVYERSDYVGGRSTVLWPWRDDPFDGSPPVPIVGRDKEEEKEEEEDREDPIELGASIFVEANENLHKAARVFNLEFESYDSVDDSEEDGAVGIWDGEEWVLREKGTGLGWWDKAKLLWRYGRSPFTVRSLVARTVSSFRSVYSPSFVSLGGFSSLANWASVTNLARPAALWASEYLEDQGVGSLFANEVVAAATTVNYGSPIDQIHGLGALVSLAATGAVSIKGGNRKMFEGFVGASGATLRLETRVTEILKLDKRDVDEGTRAKWVVKTESGQGGGTYDAIILAAPFHQTGIEIHNSDLATLIPRQPYVHLHVTIVLTNASTPCPSYFVSSSSSPSRSTIRDDQVPPTTIFSTFNTASRTKPEFNSLNYLKTLPPSLGNRFLSRHSIEARQRVHVVKLFSSRALATEQDLARIFGARNNVLKVVRKEWDAYPELAPVTSSRDLSRVRLDEGFYYVNGFERLISTMETQ
ncbi:hypothetical protein JCM10212_006528, partial [Sporobolomyces blumeae]